VSKVRGEPDALAHVRGALRNWERVDVATLKRKIDRAELERDKLTAAWAVRAADALIAPLRRELRRYV
jgi:hypothetical protein